MVKQITLRFDDEEFKKLQNAKEESKILEECSNWEEFILLKGGIK